MLSETEDVRAETDSLKAKVRELEAFRTAIDAVINGEVNKGEIEGVNKEDVARAESLEEIVAKNAQLAAELLNKAETAEIHGAEQVHIWRRSFDVPPPGGESLKMNAERTIPYFEEEILPDLEEGKNVLVSAHGNSLRSIVMHIESISPENIVSVEIATGTPRFYDYDLDSKKLIIR